MDRKIYVAPSVVEYGHVSEVVLVPGGPVLSLIDHNPQLFA